MSKITIEDMERILLKNEVPVEKVREILVQANAAVEDAKDGKSLAPKTKMEHVIILDDKNGYLKGKEIAGWVVQQEEGADAGTILARLDKAAGNQNAVTKKKANIIKDLVSLFEHLKSKFAKEQGVRLKTKDLTRVIVAASVTK
jgi:hypothetical protein